MKVGVAQRPEKQMKQSMGKKEWGKKAFFP